MAASAVSIFADLFRGNSLRYGVHVPDKGPVVEGEKAKGKSFTKDEPLTIDLYCAHCEGTTSIGVVPIDANNNVRFVAIDVDVYPLDPRRYCSVISKYNMPLTCFKTKSGGLHIYMFFSSDTPAAGALEIINEYRHLLCIPKDTEIFPKQRVLTNKGNWINLPYFGGESSERYAYDDKGGKLGFEEAMRYAANKRTTLAEAKECLERLPFGVAPPCLQAIFLNNHVGMNSKNRNIFLFNTATYLKARFKDDMPSRLTLVNESLLNPLDELELERTVLASHSRGSYSYQCDDVNLSEHCDKELCSKRTFGKGSGTISNFSFEQLVQVLSDPPYYKWTVNGIEMLFYSETELRDQNRFADYAMRHLHRVPNKVKNDVWMRILNKALADMEVEKVEIAEDLSQKTLFLVYLMEFFTERSIAKTIAHVQYGQVFIDDKKNRLFRQSDVATFLKTVKRFTGFTLQELHYHLRRLGCETTRIYDERTKRTFRIWQISEKDLAKLAYLTEDPETDNSSDGTGRTEETSQEPKKQVIQKRKTGADALREAAYTLPDTEDELLDFSDLKPSENF